MPDPIPLGPWELDGNYLIPTRCSLQRQATRLSRQPPYDPLLTLIFEDSHTITLHRSYLLALEGPLRMLVSGPFREATSHIIPLQESVACFQVFRCFLYLEPIDMSRVPTDLPLVADRWELPTLIHACLLWAEVQRRFKFFDMVRQWMPIMHFLPMPFRFSSFFALRFCLALSTVSNAAFWLSSEGLCGNWLCVDNIPNSYNSNSVFCNCPRCSSGAKLNSIKRVCFVDPFSIRREPTVAQTEGKGPLQGSWGNYLQFGENDTKVAADTRQPPKLYTLCNEMKPADNASRENMKIGRVSSVKTHASVLRKRPKSMSRDEVEKKLPCKFERLKQGSVWKVFHFQGVLSHVMHYMAHYAPGDPLPLLADVLMRQLEPDLPDDEDVEELLKELDWDNNKCATMLESKEALEWSQRARSIFRRLRNNIPHSKGDECRLVWHVEEFGSVSQLPVSLMLKKSGDYFRSIYRFSMALRCSDASSDTPSRLSLYVKLWEHNEDVLKTLDKVEVTARVSVVEDGCRCELGKVGYWPEFHGRECAEVREGEGIEGGEKLRLPMFAKGEGTTFIVMDGPGVKRWLKRHGTDCGLLISVRLLLAYDRSISSLERNETPKVEQRWTKFEMNCEKKTYSVPRDAKKTCNCESCAVNVYDSYYYYFSEDEGNSEWEEGYYS